MKKPAHDIPLRDPDPDRHAPSLLETYTNWLSAIVQFGKKYKMSH